MTGKISQRYGPYSGFLTAQPPAAITSTSSGTTPPQPAEANERKAMSRSRSNPEKSCGGTVRLRFGGPPRAGPLSLLHQVAVTFCHYAGDSQGRKDQCPGKKPR